MGWSSLVIADAGARLKGGVPSARPRRHRHARCRNTLNANHDGHDGIVSRSLIKNDVSDKTATK